MNDPLLVQKQTEVSVRRRRVRSRRDFLTTFSAATAAAACLSWTDVLKLQAAEMRRRGKACILLWMQGGPSQFETWYPKPSHENGGESKPISTAVSGVQLSENLPHTAKSLNDICVLRSLTSKEGSHPRASFLMHTGYLPTASVKYPTLGAHVAKQLGDAAAELPGFVKIGRGLSSAQGGFLGVEYDPFTLNSAKRQPNNTRVLSSQQRYRRRLNLLSRLESSYAESGGRELVEDHQQLYETTARMVTSQHMSAFDISQEPARVQQAYGDSDFGAGCLLARRLLEAGVTFVEVNAGNWDTHFDNFTRTRDLCNQVDQPYAALLNDLKQRGMLDDTLVIWLGEFGRTPRINPRTGRDHYPRAFSAALAGGGVRGGQVIGATDRGGVAVTDRPIEVVDFFRTVFHSLDIDADHEYMSNVGRPIKIVDGGQVVQEVFG